LCYQVFQYYYTMHSNLRLFTKCSNTQIPYLQQQLTRFLRPVLSLLLLLSAGEMLKASTACTEIAAESKQIATYIRESRYQQAVQTFSQLQQGSLLAQCEDPAVLSDLYVSAATAFTLVVARDSAIKYLERSLQLSTKGNLPDIRRRASVTYAMLLNQLGSYERALILYREVYREESRTAPRNYQRKSVNSFNLGLTFQNLNQADSADYYLQQALLYADKAGFDPIKPNIFGLLAEQHIRQADLAGAMRYARQALQASKKNNNSEQVLQGWLLQADVHIAANNLPEALSCLRQAERLTNDNTYTLLRAKIYKSRYQIMLGKGDSLLAVRDLLRYQQIRDTLELRNRKAQTESLSNMLQIAEEKYQLERRFNKIQRTQLIQRYSLALLVAIILIILILFRLYYIDVRTKSLLFKINLSRKKEQELGTQRHEGIFYQAVELVEKDKLFLDPDFSITQLARLLGTNEKYLSNAINEGTGDNFKAFINQYRINSIKQRIEDAIVSDNPITRFSAIGEECGFKNESTFYRVFKEETGMAPKEYANMMKKHLHP
jgi:AraC-like DNA-binding protein